MSIKFDVENSTRSFWRYASQLQGVANLEDVFIDWAAKNSQDLTLNNIQNIWENINKDVFNIRVALNKDQQDAIKALMQSILGLPEEAVEGAEFTEPTGEDIIKESPLNAPLKELGAGPNMPGTAKGVGTGIKTDQGASGTAIVPGAASDRSLSGLGKSEVKSLDVPTELTSGPAENIPGKQPGTANLLGVLAEGSI